MSAVEEKPMLNEFETAEFLGLSVSCLRNWRTTKNEDGPPYVVVGTRTIRYDRTELEQYKERKTVRPGN